MLTQYVFLMHINAGRLVQVLNIEIPLSSSLTYELLQLCQLCFLNTAKKFIHIFCQSVYM